MLKNLFLVFVTTAILFIVCTSFVVIQEKEQAIAAKKPVIYLNDFKVVMKDSTGINCRKIKDMGVVIYFNAEMKNQDLFKIELHRFGTDPDEMVAFKTFIPESKEFQKKYARMDSLKLKLLVSEDDFDISDFEVNTLIFPVESFVNETVCYYKEKHNSFYFVVRGYNKTGKKNKFGEDDYDRGKDLTPRSFIFKNWEIRTK